MFFNARNSFLLTTQAISVIVCITAFIVNLKRKTRIALIIMIFLICMSIIIWAYIFDGGRDVRWYVVLALFPLYFFSITTRRDKVLLTILIAVSFLAATLIAFYDQPVVTMTNMALFNTLGGIILMVAFALELLLFKAVNDMRDNELKRIETIVDNIQCGIIIVDAETHEIIEINKIAMDLHGGEKESLVGMECHKLACAEDGGTCPILDMKEGVSQFEQSFINKNMEAIPILKSVVRIYYNDRPALLESFTDITHIKEAEEKLRLLEIAEKGNIAKSKFLSRMSHEMRTPMNAIIGMTKIAKGTEDINRLKHCLSIIDASSLHLLGIINDVLDMSKIESGKLELDCIPFTVGNVLAKVSDILLEQAIAKGIDLSIQTDIREDTWYLGDEMRLIQVITNIVSNAVKFTSEGGRIELSIYEQQKEDDFSILQFRVSDTGIGMTKEQCSRLFNAFEQADVSVTRKYGGTGLGLAISKSIVEIMGGEISIESELNKGSVFTFDVKLEHSYEQGKSEISTVEGLVEMPDFSGITILLAEDVEINREILITLLEDSGITIDVAENGIEAVQKFKNNAESYHMIIMDIHMPIMDGYQATESIRELDFDKAKTIPIIALTADVFKEDISKCLASGMNGHLKKPIEIEKVIEMLSHYC
jgi:PAS domain S-box-containing protein